jgi:hypothetical protein
MAGIVVCFCSNVENGVLIPTGGALEESSNGNDELSSLRWKNSVGVDPKVDSGSNVGNGTSIPTGGVRESTDAYDELSSRSWKSSGEAIRKRNQAESLGVYNVDLQLTVRLDEYSIPGVIIWKTMKDLRWELCHHDLIIWVSHRKMQKRTGQTSNTWSVIARIFDLDATSVERVYIHMAVIKLICPMNRAIVIVCWNVLRAR